MKKQEKKKKKKKKKKKFSPNVKGTSKSNRETSKNKRRRRRRMKKMRRGAEATKKNPPFEGGVAGKMCFLRSNISGLGRAFFSLFSMRCCKNRNRGTWETGVYFWALPLW